MVIDEQPQQPCAHAGPAAVSGAPAAGGTSDVGSDHRDVSVSWWRRQEESEELCLVDSDSAAPAIAVIKRFRQDAVSTRKDRIRSRLLYCTVTYCHIDAVIFLQREIILNCYDSRTKNHR
jgi:hypothetical protein